MSELSLIQYLLIALVFVWSGFVRSGLAFGGAVLSLPFLLLIHNDPLVFLPIISVHLLVFSSLTIWMNNRKPAGSAVSEDSTGPAGTVDWQYLWKILGIMIVPKLIGVFGLITLPSAVMSSIIFVIVSVYAVSYILNKPFRSKSPFVDTVFLMLGGYISGTSLIGAPLVIAVAAQHLPKERLRDTLFALWFILVTIKMAAFVWADIDLQLIHHLWLLPCATVGHVLGLWFHERMLKSEPRVFFRFLGVVLLVVSSLGLWRGLAG
ncbi:MULTISPECIES: TSUP family transporter [Marinobacter]|uniref:Probable membrane transporter protein n=1 Tax=Marinobacter profundi TaxID=2666256 RepID=A0A2G1UM81_9GAMM|nr:MULTISPECIES: TSUP family transporter [Marinobacter]MBD3655132.1 sulfite exporter TauE/SafE family protein [Marinobacter sp.]PHQ15572.1 permease [Marinobacter profundi]